MKTLLAAAGYRFNEQCEIWHRPDYKGIDYSDGDQIERRIGTLVSQAKDLSVLSPELSRHCTDWASLYHLSPTRANILRPFESLLSGDVLEVGAGCGAISRYLGECGGNIVSLEGSPRRAAIARSRTRDLTNVTVVSDNFDAFRCDRKFDVVVLVGVFEYASMFMSGDQPAPRMLERVRSFLKPSGKLIIAIENQLGLKYFAGAPEDHISVPMYGIEGRYRHGQPETYGRKALSAMLTGSGFRRVEFLAPFPDYKLPSSIITESGFAAPNFDAAALAWQSVWHDVQLPDQLAFNPALAWPTITLNGLGIDLANSFLVLACNEELSSIPDSRLAWHFSASRNPRFCKVTNFIKDSTGEVNLSYLPLSTTHGDLDHEPLITQQLPPRVNYVHGECLSLRLVRILSQEYWKVDDVVDFVKSYLDYLQKIASQRDVKIDLAKADSLLPGSLFDCIPQNLVITDNNEAIFIDQEWEVKDSLQLGYLLTRALFPALHGAAHCAIGPDTFDGSRLGLFLAVTSKLGWSLTQETVEAYANHETQILEEILPNCTALEDYLAWIKSPIKVRSNFNHILSHRNAKIADLERDRVALESEISDLKQIVIDRDHNLALLRSDIEERDSIIARQRSLFAQKIAESDQQLTKLQQQVAALDAHIQHIAGSRSWKLTQPLRDAADSIRTARGIVRLAKHQVGHLGINATTRKVLRAVRRDGFRAICRRVATLGAQDPQIPLAGSSSDQKQRSDPLSFVPYYIDPALDSKQCESSDRFSLAVHLHLFYRDMTQEVCERLANIKRPFDLFVSVGEDTNCSEVQRQLRSLLPHADKIIVKRVPNRGRDISPFIVLFGKRLARYDIIGHFHTKKSIHNPALKAWCMDVLELLLGWPGSSGGHVAHIFQKLRTSAKVVYPEGRREFLQDRSRWADNREIAQKILKSYTEWSIDDFPTIEFPEGSMFWARGESMREMLRLPLKFEDFPAEPIPPDGTLAHALERLILVFAASQPGHNLRLHRGDSIADYRFYEPQQDFSSSIAHTDIKVLSFYLPQFHPIPENDEWHGEGFTEWVKVRSASPLFRGHYQQHIPHQDIGYYLLESPDTLRKQAELMRCAGVSGQVFYHYWFNGRLILEQPAQMLLSNSDIKMPFCFCWANENWTRRWDGNEAEILLAQDYSENDAREFIRYLIPFFRDERHLRVEDRPLLLVYRPSSIKDPQMYLKVWAEECRAHGLNAPYVVAVLTRGATNPTEFGMDAGVERVLHDWTAGAVPEIKHSLQRYTEVNGSVLSYPEVANFYSSQTDAKNFTYFRSIVPTWDNTARYGTEAFLVHGSTPEYFQEWFEKLIAYSKNTLPEDRRFILVNAWNEWAEGAHLEPDSRFGYSYLNSVGRALSNTKYSEQFKTDSELDKSLRVHLRIQPYLVDLLDRDPNLAERFIKGLSNSSIVANCDVTIDKASADLVSGIRPGTHEDADFIVEFRRLAFFSAKLIEQLIRFANSKAESPAIPNFYGDAALVNVLSNSSIESFDAHSSPIVVYPGESPSGGFKNFRMCTHAPCFLTQVNTVAEAELPVVTTVIRFHKSGDLNLLGHALGCLVAMRNCICVPLIAAQDLSPSQAKELTNLLADFPWHTDNQPIVHHYQSPSGIQDLRSKMLNESLRQIKSRYAAFLDYDDLLMPHAYEWLINRLKQTGKAVAFGRVYSTYYNVARGQFLERAKAYEYGYSYAEFVRQNHAPLHSFLLDVSKLDLDALVYYDDQRYLEDYFLTLQLFTEENCDWEGLKLNQYIGDYIHSIDRSHTLAFTDDSERQMLLKQPDYILCENRIEDLRLGLLGKEKGPGVEKNIKLASNNS